MSFRDNLQHLRAAKGMTQEQLAMLLGVSRQAVTKWESERAYPEMDKLLKMCQIFECTLDELVQGDRTQRPAGPAAASGPAGPAQDVCGYDEHQRMMAWKVPTGIACILLGIAIGLFFEGALPLASWNGKDGLFTLVVLVGALAGLAFLVPAGMAHAAFVKAHPFIEDFYTEDDRAGARKAFSGGLIAGIAFIIAGIGCLLMLEESAENAGLFFLLNSRAQSQRVGAVCGAIMILATIVALILLFAPVLTSPDPDNFEPLGTSAAWFWLAWVVGGLLCGIVSVLMNAFGKRG